MALAPVITGVTPSPATVGDAVTVSLAGVVDPPTITSFVPNPAQVGDTVTVSLFAPGIPTVDLSALIPASASLGQAGITIALALEAVVGAAATATAGQGGVAAPPTITGASPDPATVGDVVTIALADTAAPNFTAQVAAVGALVGAMSESQALAAVVAAVGRITSGLAHTVVVPATLLASDANSATGAASGDSMVLDLGEWAEWLVSVATGRDLGLMLSVSASGPGQLRVLLDGVVVGTVDY